MLRVGTSLTARSEREPRVTVGAVLTTRGNKRFHCFAEVSLPNVPVPLRPDVQPVLVPMTPL